jgi:hypothetical protein
MFVVVQKGPVQVIANQWHGVVEMNVVYATLLHDQKYADLTRLLEINMVASFNSLERMGFKDGNQSSARLLRGYYDLTGSNPPELIDPYLSGVRGTDVRRLASAMTLFSKDSSPLSPH